MYTISKTRVDNSLNLENTNVSSLLKILMQKIEQNPQNDFYVFILDKLNRRIPVSR